MRYLYALAAVMLAACTASPALAQSVTGCGTVAIPKAQTSDAAKLTAGADCFAKAEAIAASAKQARRDRAATLAPDPRAKLGINVGGTAYWSGEQTFANQAAVLEWRDPAGGWGYVAADRLKGGVPMAIEPGHSLIAYLTPPAAAFRSEGPETRCTWTGKGSVWTDGAATTDRVTNGFSFSWPKTAKPAQTVAIKIDATDASDPVRDIDCREPAEGNAVYAAQLLNYLRPFGVLRFLDWSSTNGNPASVTWATRGRAGVNAVSGSDGVALEYQVGLANAAGANPWFTIPWNADEDYHRRAAQLVKAAIPAGRQVYVELSNEVWNYQFGVTGQAEREGVAAKLSDNKFQAALSRYAQKTSWAMKIWASVFADRPGQLVRVVSTQNDNPWTAEVVMGWGDLAANVDALATAPYFGHGFFDANPTETNVDKLMGVLAGYAKGVVAGSVTQNAAIARKYGKRYITYEAGQHVVGPDRVPLVTQMQRSPLMEPIYRDFVAGMAEKTDLLTLYAATGGIGQYGAWGLREYAGQPIAETPKLRGVVGR
jgi:hypothetical protein